MSIAILFKLLLGICVSNRFNLVQSNLLFQFGVMDLSRIHRTDPAVQAVLN